MKISKIIHGHRDLTETFLGPSDKIKSLKRRLQRAEKQRRSSIETNKLKKRSLQMREEHSNRGTKSASRDSTHSSRSKRSMSHSQESHFLASTSNMRQKHEVRFKPTSR